MANDPVRVDQLAAQSPATVTALTQLLGIDVLNQSAAADLYATDRRLQVPVTMLAQANAPSHGWVAASGNTATLNLNDTSYSPLGTQSIRIDTDGVSGAGRIDKTGLVIDFTGKSPVLWISVDDVSKLNGLSLYLGNSTLSWYYLWQFAPKVVGVNEMQNGKFVRLTLNWGDATTSGAVDRTSITTARLYAQDVGTGPCTVRFSGLATLPEPTGRYPKGVVVFTCDDGRITQWSQMKRVLDQYGYPATAYIIADRIDSDPANWLTSAQLQSMQNDSGWEIAAHAYATATHDAVGGFTAFTESQLIADLSAMKRWLSSNGFRGGDHIAYPQGFYNDTVLKVARRLFTSARGTWGKGGIDETFPPADPYRIRTAMLTSGAETTLAKIKAHIDVTVANKGMCVITAHAFGATADSLTWVTSDFEQLVAYVAASGAAVRTMGAAMRGD